VDFVLCYVFIYRVLWGYVDCTHIVIACMPRLDIEYARVSDDRYIHIYRLISCFHPKYNDVRQDLFPQIVTYTYYTVSLQVLYNLTMAQ